MDAWYRRTPEAGATSMVFATAVAGPFGRVGGKRHDLIGRAVETAATLDGSGVTLSVEAFRKLGPGLRTRFRKHALPITDIPTEDPRRPR